MCEAALATAQGDADKVRANGVRAVGGLLGLLSPGLAEHAGLDVGRCACVKWYFEYDDIGLLFNICSFILMSNV